MTANSLQIDLASGSALTSYQYSVEAVNTTQTSARTLSNNLVVGDPLESAVLR